MSLERIMLSYSCANNYRSLVSSFVVILVCIIVPWRIVHGLTCIVGVIIKALYCVFLFDNRQSFLIIFEASIRYHRWLNSNLSSVTDIIF